MSETDFNKLPNFFLIGASKSGTTSLHEILGQHPGIFVSKIKETCFFSTGARYSRGLQWYQDTHFRNAGGYPRRGESSVPYLYWSSFVASRIKEVYGEREVKFIAIFRDPVQRAYSEYWMKVHRGFENRSFAEALAGEEEILQRNRDQLQRDGSVVYGYYRGSCYATLLQPFLELFPRQNFSLLLLEDLHQNFTGTMAGLANFLGVRSDFDFQFSKSNPASLPRNPELHRFLHRPSGLLHNLIRPITNRLSYNLRHEIKKIFLKANLRQESSPPMDPDVERQLRVRYREEIKQLEIILGRSLSHWLQETT